MATAKQKPNASNVKGQELVRFEDDFKKLCIFLKENFRFEDVYNAFGGSTLQIKNEERIDHVINYYLSQKSSATAQDVANKVALINKDAFEGLTRIYRKYQFDEPSKYGNCPTEKQLNEKERELKIITQSKDLLQQNGILLEQIQTLTQQQGSLINQNGILMQQNIASKQQSEVDQKTINELNERIIVLQTQLEQYQAKS